MLRTFCTGAVRKKTELSGKLWDFSPLEGEHAGQRYPVFVPCCWENLPDFSAYRGVGSFRTVFKGEGTVRLVFKGVSHTATVLVDGKECASHYNAYTPFSVILKGLEKGEHQLEVLADNRFSEASALHVPNDYMSYGGISRGVEAQYLGDVYIDTVHVIPKQADGKWSAAVSVRAVNLTDAPKTYRLSLNLAAPQCRGVEAGSDGDNAACADGAAHENGCAAKGAAFVNAADNQTENTACRCIGSTVYETELTLAPNETKTAEAVFDCPDAKIWSIEEPWLYRIQAVLSDETGAVDDLIERFGFREIRTEGKDILLNGRKIRIKGFCRHEDHPMFGCALPPAAMEQDLQIAVDLGANSIRTSHYPNDEIFLDLCDEQGILLWEENHARGLSLEQMQNPHFEEQAEACIREMIDAHINHPAIIIWGILNECASETEYGYECYKKQYDLIQSLDTSRPRSSASCKFKTDICFGLPEIVSYNLYPEWYHDTPAGVYVKDIYNWVQEESEGSGKPFLVTEIGAGAIYGYRSQTMCKWTEEYQAKALEDQITAVLGLEGCSGIYIWQFCDVRISNEWFSTRPRTMNNKGVVDEYRRRKLAYDVVKRLYHSYGNYRD